MTNLPASLINILTVLAPYDPYLVGGCVRDSLMGITPHDYDLASRATPEEVSQLFKVIPTGIEHGTVTIQTPEGLYEHTTFRSDVVSINHRKAEVKYSSTIQEDLSRRDFTINSIAYSLTKGYIDPYDGLSDITNRIIRTVGNPIDRFNEDALRILRAIRFSVRYNFTIESNTLKAIKDLSVDNGYEPPILSYLSKERIHKELIQIYDYPKKCPLRETKDVFIYLYNTYSIPNNILQSNHSYLYNTYNLMYTIYKGDKELIKSWLKDYKYTNKEISSILNLCNIHEEHYTGIQLIQYLRTKYPDNDIKIYYESDAEMIHLVNSTPPLILDISPQLLLDNNYPPNTLSTILKHLTLLVIDNPSLNNQSLLLKYLKEEYSQS